MAPINLQEKNTMEVNGWWCYQNEGELLGEPSLLLL